MMDNFLTARNTAGASRVRRQLGVSLIEALVAMAVMTFGMLAVVGVQATLRMNADIAKQRSEATRIAEEEIERLRSFREIASVAGEPLGWDEVVGQMGANAAMVVANTTYTVDRSVGAPAGSPQKTVNIAVNWSDRYGNEQSVVLRNVVAGAAPVLSGLLSVAPTRAAPSLRKSRHPTIPVRATQLSDGSGESVFKPTEVGTLAWTFNDVTGVITSVCTVAAESTSNTLTRAQLTICAATAAQLLSGSVRFNLRGLARELVNDHDRFVLKPIPGGTVAWKIRETPNRVYGNCPVAAADSTATLATNGVDAGCVSVDQSISPFTRDDALADPLVAGDAEGPTWPALPLAISLTLTSAGHPAGPLCYSDSPTHSLSANESRQHVVEYFCIVFPNEPRTWSGQSLVVAGAFSDAGAATWSIGTGDAAYRVCRYTRAGTPETSNADHPLAYVDVSGNLINQNFLVVAGPKACPTDVAANPATGDLVNSNTLQHQP